jgi:hypothetical protein
MIVPLQHITSMCDADALLLREIDTWKVPRVLVIVFVMVLVFFNCVCVCSCVYSCVCGCVCGCLLFLIVIWD